MLAGPMIACGAPFLLGGGLALTYDITMWRSFRNVAAAAVAKGRHRLRRHSAQVLPSTPTAVAAPAEDGPTITIPTVVLDDTFPLYLHYDPVEHARAHRRAAADARPPRTTRSL
jgi:hypothetical protein